MPSLRCLVLTLMLSAIAPTFAAIQDDPDPDLEQLTQQLQDLSETREKRRIEYLSGVRRQLLEKIQASGASGNYMIECMRELRFGMKAIDSDYSEWKKQNRNLFSDKNFEVASSLHLKYLVLTLERSMQESSEDMVTKVWAYLQDLDNAKETLAFVDKPKQEVKLRVVNNQKEVVDEIVGDMKQLEQATVRQRAGPDEIHQYVEQFLTTAVDSGFPGQVLKLNGRMETYPDWAMEPGDYGGILETNIRPFLREAQDDKLLWTWDEEIRYRREVIQLSKDGNRMREFETEELPRLLWKKAKDAELIGLTNKALKLKIDIARQYPAHTDFEKWTTEIETAIKSRIETQEAGESSETDAQSTELIMPGYFGSPEDQKFITTDTDTATPEPTPLPPLP